MMIRYGFGKRWFHLFQDWLS